MKPEFQKVLDSISVELTEQVDPDGGLQEKLRNLNVLMPRQINGCYKAIFSREEKMAAILAVLRLADDSSYEKFRQCLKETGHSGFVEKYLPHETELGAAAQTPASYNKTAQTTATNGDPNALMSAENQKKLTSNYQKLVDTLRVDPVLPYLIQNDCLSLDESQTIGHCITDSDKAKMFLGLFVKKPNRAFDVFVTALNKTAQQHVADLLD